MLKAALLLVLALAIAAAIGVGTARADTSVAAAAPPAAATGDPCKLLSFSTGPIDVDAAGLVIVHVDPIAANVQLSGLLGTLICPLLGGGTPAPVPAQ